MDIPRLTKTPIGAFFALRFLRFQAPWRTLPEGRLPYFLKDFVDYFSYLWYHDRNLSLKVGRWRVQWVEKYGGCGVSTAWRS